MLRRTLPEHRQLMASPRTTRPLLIALILVLSALLVWLTWAWGPAEEPQTADGVEALAAVPTGGDFSLHSWKGPLSLADLRGKLTLIYFGYTWCPDICPTNLAILALALRQLTPAERARVQVLFVSVDPERDSVERLKEYTAYFHPDILGVTGSEAEVAAAAKAYGAAYRRSEGADSAMGYVVDHSAYTYVVDPKGALVARLDHATPSEEIAAMIRARLAEAH